MNNDKDRSDEVDERIQNIINEQGWDDHSVRSLFLDFVKENGLAEKLIEFLYEVAEDENAEDVEDDVYEEITDGLTEE